MEDFPDNHFNLVFVLTSIKGSVKTVIRAQQGKLASFREHIQCHCLPDIKSFRVILIALTFAACPVYETLFFIGLPVNERKPRAGTGNI